MSVRAPIEAEVQYVYQPVYILQTAGYAWNYDTLGELHESSGTLVLPLPPIAPGDRFDAVSLEVEGMPFQGLLRNWSGVAVQRSAQTLDTSGNWTDVTTGSFGVILDLGGMWSVLELRVQDSSALITCVLPWLGTDFALGSVFPAQSSTYPTRVPKDPGADKVALRGVQSQKLYVQFDTGSLTVDQVLDHLVIVSGVYPQNLRARLDTGDVFWTHPGELRGQTLVTGLHDSLNALAGELETIVAPNLVLETDAPGVIVAPEDAFGDLVAEKGTEATWAGDPGTSVAVKPGEEIDLPLIFTDDGSGTDWTTHSLRIDGRYDASPWRMDPLETPQVLPAPMGLEVNAHFAAGRWFTVTRDTELHGLSLPLAGEGSGNLLLELVADEDGLPSGEALATADLPVEADPDGGWHEALFEEPLALASGQSFWVLLKAREGGARWLAVAREESDSRYSEEGGTWSEFPRVYRDATGAARLPQAMLRLLRLPHPEENEALLSLELPGRSGPLVLSWNRQREDEPLEWSFPESNAPDLPPPGPAAGRTWEATILSLAGGTLEIERVELFYHL